MVQHMVNISGNKVVQKLVGNFFLAKGFFVNMDVYLCAYSEYGHQKLRLCKPAAIKSQKVIV